MRISDVTRKFLSEMQMLYNKFENKISYKKKMDLKVNDFQQPQFCYSESK